MQKFYYFVRIECETKAIQDSFVAWLRNGHYAAVIAAGALNAELVYLDPLPNADPNAPCVMESRYEFPSREAFARYEAGPAIALRAEGMTKFPPSSGVRMSRATGTSMLSAS